MNLRPARWSNLAGALSIALSRVPGRARDRAPLIGGRGLLVASSACTRFRGFQAEAESARDPRSAVVVVMPRERSSARRDSGS